MLLRRSDAHIRLPVAQILTRIGRQLLPALLVVLAAAALVTMITRPFTQWGAAADQRVAQLGNSGAAAIG